MESHISELQKALSWSKENMLTGCRINGHRPSRLTMKIWLHRKSKLIIFIMNVTTHDCNLEFNVIQYNQW